MCNITKDTLEKIKKDDIKPTPKWHFLLKSWVMWVAFGVALVIGAMSVSISLFLISNEDFELHEEFERGFGEHVLLSLPYVWLVLLVLFLAVAVYNFHHTRGGYKFKSILIWLASIIASLILGVAFFYAGFGQALDDVAEDTLPFYEGFEERREKLFEGKDHLIAGEVVEITNDTMIVVDAFEGQTWTVSIDEETKTPPLEVGMRIGAVGERQDNNTFEAEAIMPWDAGPGRGGPFGRHSRPPRPLEVDEPDDDDRPEHMMDDDSRPEEMMEQEGDATL